MPSKPQPLNFTADQLLNRIQRIEQCISDLEAFDPQNVQKRDDAVVRRLEAAIRDALLSAFGAGTDRFNIYKDAFRLDQGPRGALGPSWTAARSGYRGHVEPDFRKYLLEGKERSIGLLKTAVDALGEEYKELVAQDQATQIKAAAKPSSKVFMVHGHDKAVREEVARFLEKLGLEVIILDEQPNQGRTILEKFEDHAQETGFAVVLLTPDDIAEAKSGSGQAERARQNVIYELGYLRHALGKGKVCLLRKGDVEMPSDLAGLVYTELDEKDGWKVQLVRELKAAKLQFDANRAYD
jgi:predicted nucleotide-binding protein